MCKENGVKSYKLAIFIVLASYLTVYLIEEWVTHSMAIQSVADSVFNLRTIYQKLITAGPRELRPNYTVLVDINPDKDPAYKKVTHDIGDPCGEKGTRNTLAQLLDKIAEQKPAVIVIDKFFSNICDNNDPGLEPKPGTKKLAETLQRISQQTPIIVGRLAHYDIEQKIPVLEAVQPLLTSEDKPGIHDGIVNLDLDNRKMALEWQVKPDESRPSKKMPTLSFAAVKAYYEAESAQPATENPKIKELDKLDERGKNPYISFIERSKFDLIPAGALITSGSSDNFSRLRGKIVIIGESDNLYDQHDSVFYSKIPGFILQANYIEAMLDQRCYKSIPQLDYVIGFGMFVAVYLCGQMFSELKTLRKLIGYLCAILVFVFLLLYLVVALLGYYINPVTISLLGITIIITHPLLHIFQSQNNNQEVKNEKFH